MLNAQQSAPAFSVVDENNALVSLAGFKGDKNLVLYFYPKDDTPGCTIEANQFTQYIDEFSALDTVVYGVSKDNCVSHIDFINKFALQVGLLADTDGKLCDAYGVWQEKEKKGVKKMGIVRSTFVIDKDGVIRYAEYGVVAEGHAQLILDVVKKL
ncbi:MAG: peroxiredoxin [Gammaproteobacteria bacterium]|nr:peroxiredoxin [Gammaproteobacteria bacterium]